MDYFVYILRAQPAKCIQNNPERPAKRVDIKKERILIMVDEVPRRKAEHVQIALQQDLSAPQAASWRDIRLIHQALAEAFTLEQVQRAITMIGANALAVHMNSLQEAAQPEGDRRAVGEVDALKELARQIALPIIAKETGAGICREQALLLKSCGVAAIDVGGAGGSSMSAMEAVRSAE